MEVVIDEEKVLNGPPTSNDDVSLFKDYETGNDLEFVSLKAEEGAN